MPDTSDIDGWIKYGKELADWYAAEQKRIMDAIGGNASAQSSGPGKPPHYP